MHMSKAESIMLNSNSLVLKELRSTDVTQQYVDWLNNPKINQYLESRFTLQDKYKVKEFVRNCKQSDLCFLFGVFTAGNMKHIGNIKLGPINLNHNYAEIGIIIGDIDSWGMGFASKAISMVTHFGFYQLKLFKISAGCYENNIGSKKAFEKSGYQVEGFLANQVESAYGREGIWRLGCFKDNFNSVG